MNQLICDLCGKPIKSMGEYRKFKIKERKHSFHESWWVKIDVHEECVKKLYNTIKEKEDSNNV